VDRAGGDRLARAVLTEDEDGRTGVGDTFDQVEHSRHLVVATDDVRDAELLVELLLQLLVLFDDPLLAEGPLDREIEFVIDDRLGQIVERASLDRFHGAFNCAVTRKQDDRGIRLILRDPFQDVETVLIGQADVGEDDVEVVFADAGERVLAVHGRFSPVAQRAEIVRHGLADVTVIVNDQQISLNVHQKLAAHRQAAWRAQGGARGL